MDGKSFFRKCTQDVFKNDFSLPLSMASYSAALMAFVKGFQLDLDFLKENQMALALVSEQHLL